MQYFRAQSCAYDNDVTQPKTPLADFTSPTISTRLETSLQIPTAIYRYTLLLNIFRDFQLFLHRCTHLKEFRLNYASELKRINSFLNIRSFWSYFPPNNNDSKFNNPEHRKKQTTG